MKIVLATCGSRGDVQPMLALALGLQQRGHTVWLAGPPEKAAWAARLGCPFRPLGRDMTAFIDRISRVYSLHSAARFLRFVHQEVASQFSQLPDIVAGADLAVGSSLAFGLASVAEAMGIAYRYIVFTPQLLPSGTHPFPGIAGQRLPRWLNRLSWQTVRLLDRLWFDRAYNRFRRNIGLSPSAEAWRTITGDHVIVASDSAVAPVPADVTDPRYTQTGYMHLQQPMTANPALSAFLADGPPPFYAGFGSMPKNDQIQSVTPIVQAARMAGVRVIIGKFWESPPLAVDPHAVLFLNKYPHLDLFPRVAAVIHHGGAGTTAAAAISGVPQIIVPHVLDQHYWGERIRQAGLGPAPIPRSRLTADHLAAAMTAVITDQSYQRRSTRTAGRIRQQDGVAAAIAALLQS